MQLMHEIPGLSRQQLRTALGARPPVGAHCFPGLSAAVGADLADQVEQIKIAPVYLSGKIYPSSWTAMQARYRPSMAYSCRWC